MRAQTHIPLSVPVIKKALGTINISVRMKSIVELASDLNELNERRVFLLSSAPPHEVKN